MNIIEAYIKFKGQLIIYVSGLSGTGITVLGKNIANDFKLSLVNMKDYCKKDYNVTGKLANGKEIINWDSDNIYDWQKAEEEIKKKIKDSKTIVIVGTALSKDKLSEILNPDFHIHIKLAKQNLLKRREKYIELHESCNYNKEKQDNNIATQIFNSFTFAYYNDLLQRSNISKFINANEYVALEEEKYNDKVYDDAFNYLIHQISKYLDSVPPENVKNIENNIINKETENEDSDTISTDSLSEEIDISSTDIDDMQERYIIRPDGRNYTVKDDFLY